MFEVGGFVGRWNEVTSRSRDSAPHVMTMAVASGLGGLGSEPGAVAVQRPGLARRGALPRGHHRVLPGHLGCQCGAGHWQLHRGLVSGRPWGWRQSTNAGCRGATVAGANQQEGVMLAYDLWFLVSIIHPFV